MADSYYPAATYYDDGRQPYHRNRSWVNDAPHPPPPKRSFSNMDPRRPAHERPVATPDPRLARPEKRNASHSPDGARPAKQTRSEQPNDDLSRRSSTSNGVNRHPGADRASPNRRPSLHNGVEPNGKGLNSPDSRNGARDGLSSGRSTPHQQPAAPRNVTAPKAAPVQTPGPTRRGNDDVIAALGQFMTQTGEYAALKYHKEETEARFKRADAVYQSNKQHFPAFPALKDRKTKPRDAAQEELRNAQQQLEAYANKQQDQIRNLAGLITPPEQPTLSKEDFVSIQAFNDLKASYEGVQNEIRAFKATAAASKIGYDLVKKTQSEIVEKLSKAEKAYELSQSLKQDDEKRALWQSKTDNTLSRIDNSMSELPKLRSEVQQLFSWKQETVSHFAKIESVEEKTRKVEVDVHLLTDFKATTVEDTEALKKRMEEIENVSKTTSESLSGLRDDQSTLSKQVSQLSDGVPASESTPVPELAKKLESMSLELSKMRSEFASKEDHDELEDTQYKIDERLGKVETIIRKNASPKGPRDSARPGADVSPSVRLSNGAETSASVAELSGAPPAIGDRVHLLENRVETLEKRGIRGYASDRSQPDGPLPPADVASLYTEYQALRADLDKLDASQENISAEIFSFVEEHIDKVTCDIQDLQSSRDTTKKAVDDTKAAMEQWMTGINAAVLSKASAESLVPLSTAVDKQGRSMETVVMKQDQLTSVFEGLKRRYDNLTTDDVVRCMVNQMQALLPNAATAAAIEDSLSRAHGGINQLRIDFAKGGGNHEIAKQYQEMVKQYQEIGKQYQEVQRQVNHTLETVRKPLPIHQRLENIPNDLTNLSGTVTKMSNTINSHTTRLDGFENIRTAMQEQQAARAVMEVAIGELAGKVDALKQIVDEQ